MKEKIYTIPINEAFSADTECPVCAFLKKEEADKVEYVLGDSMMQPDERIVFNEKGFCNRHTEMMYMFGNKLSHALVEETRLEYLSEAISKVEKSIKKPKKAVFGKNKFKDELDGAFAPLGKAVSSCVICERLNAIMKGFIENLFYMYKNDSDFRNKFFASKGFCIHHFKQLAKAAGDELNPDEAYEFITKLCNLEKENLERVKEDVNWFTKKFDYRYEKESWKNSRDAVIRGAEKTAMYIKGEKQS